MKLKYLWSNQTGTQTSRNIQYVSKIMLGPNNNKNICRNNQHNMPLKRIKRFRSAFTTYQINYLEAEFRKFPYIGTMQRRDVAAALKIPERAVKIWFQNRRMKEKKDIHLKETDDGKTCRKVLESTEEELHPAGSFQSTIGIQIDSLPVIINENEIKNVNYNVHNLRNTENVKLIHVGDKSCEALSKKRISVPEVTLTRASIPQNNRCHKISSYQHLLNTRKYSSNKNIIEDNTKQSPTHIRKPEVVKSVFWLNENNEYGVAGDLCVDKQKVSQQKYQMENSEENNSTSKNIKRYRSAFTTEQTSYLEREFKKIQYIGNTQRKEIADALKLPESAVKIWFQNRRMKEKKESCVKEYEEHTNRKMLEFPKKQSTALNDVQAINGKASCTISLMETYVNKVINSNDDSKASNQEINIVNIKETMNSSSEESVNKSHKRDPLMVENGKVPSNFNNLSTISCKNKQKIDIKQKELSQINSHHSKYYQDAPQDLSLKQQKSTQTWRAEPKLTQTGSNLCPNTYIPHGGILWKPLNIVPVVSAGSSLCLPVDNASNLLTTEEQYSQTVKCNCDCHMKMFSVPMVLPQNTTSPHFIIATLPVSNNSQNPSFNVNV